MDHIPVGRPTLTDAERMQAATEEAFAKLIERASALGLKLAPVMGLMYLPDQQVTEQFREACRAVIGSLKICRKQD